jgi:deoxycytidylate deaminase
MKFEALAGYDVGQVAALYASGRSTIAKFQTGAAIVDSRRVVSIGWSHVGPIRWETTPWSTHAEAHAIRRAGRNVSGCDIYIATRSRKGNLTYSAPCSKCTDLLKNFGFLNVVYTTPDGWVWS